MNGDDEEMTEEQMKFESELRGLALAEHRAKVRKAEIEAVTAEVEGETAKLVRGHVRKMVADDRNPLSDN